MRYCFRKQSRLDDFHSQANLVTPLDSALA
jgi:hypothetical protein